MGYLNHCADLPKLIHEDLLQLFQKRYPDEDFGLAGWAASNVKVVRSPTHIPNKAIAEGQPATLLGHLRDEPDLSR